MPQNIAHFASRRVNRLEMDNAADAARGAKRLSLASELASAIALPMICAPRMPTWTPGQPGTFCRLVEKP